MEQTRLHLVKLQQVEDLVEANQTLQETVARLVVQVQMQPLSAHEL
jgi:hypothetical protein